MNVQPTPTSPKTRSSQKEAELSTLYGEKGHAPFLKPHGRRTVSLRTLFLSVIIGLLAGVLGGMVYNVYVSEWLVGENQPTTLLNRVRSASSIFSVNETRKSLLAMYPARSEEQGDLPYASDEQRGTGLLLSSDGWAVTTADVLAEGLSVAVTHDQKVFRVEERVDDPATDLVYFRIGGSRYAVTSLQTPNFALGMSYHAVAGGMSEGTSSVRSVTIERLRAARNGATAEESSDEYSRVVGTDGVLSIAFAGAPVVDDAGAVVGLIGGSDDRASFWPASVATSVLETLLSQKTVVRSSLGITYVDLALTPGVPEEKRSSRLQGALVTKKEFASVNKGIQPGDVITMVGERTLNAEFGLQEAVQSLKPESVTTFTLIRDGAEQKIPITLDAFVATTIR